MDAQGKNPGSASLPESGASRKQHVAGSESYAGAGQMADDLGIGLLAELRYQTPGPRWEEDLSLLSETGWVSQCEELVRGLVLLREVSPLDVVAVCALTDGVPIKPFLYSLGMAVRKVLQRVVLMDCDLRTPWPLGTEDKREVEGFIDMVKHGCSFFTVSRETDVSGLYVIGAGSHPVLSEGELVGKDLERAFNSLRTKSDLTFARVPPFLPGRKVNPVLGCVDAVLVCASRPSARKSEMADGYARLWESDVPILGVVNFEPKDFEERTTVVLSLASHSSEAADALDAGPGGGPDTTAKAGAAVEPGAGDAAPERIELEHTPECGPLLPPGDEEVDSGRMSGATPGEELGAGTGWAAPAGLAGAGEPARRAVRRPWSRVRSAEERFLERELFGRRRISSRLALLIGLPVVLAALVVTAVLSPRIGRPRVEPVDSDMMRSILLPGSDGVVGTGEVQTAGVAVPSLPGAGDSAAQVLAVASYYVHVSSHKMYQSALEDSARVAGAGFRASVQLVRLSELGRWHRVLAGPFHTAEAAQAAAARIQPMGLAKQVRIIQEGVSE
ncbi:MAG: SPOR domain-containing protein [Candidatus Eisenbacteria bacterium]|nr:SPOR domain-containing protein [Candidatus Eisenbacteria bacterium]